MGVLDCRDWTVRGQGESWLSSFVGSKDINNPKIPSKFVLAHGELLWGEPPDLTRPKRAPARARKPRK